MTAEYDYYDYGGARQDYDNAHPRMGHIAGSKDSQPDSTGSFMCKNCGIFFEIVELKHTLTNGVVAYDGSYGGVVNRDMVLCSTCHLQSMARHHRLWRDVLEVLNGQPGNS